MPLIPTTPEFIEIYVNNLLLIEESGRVAGVEKRLMLHGEIIEHHGTEMQKALLRSIRARHSKAVEYERVNGPFSLVKWEHPEVRSTIEFLEHFRVDSDLVREFRLREQNLSSTRQP